LTEIQIDPTSLINKRGCVTVPLKVPLFSAVRGCVIVFATFSVKTHNNKTKQNKTKQKRQFHHHFDILKKTMEKTKCLGQNGLVNPGF
jgi:hypothetical protein